MDHRHERCRAVDHGGVDHLALAGAGGLEQGGHHAEGQQHAAAAEVAHEVQRRHGSRIGPAQRPQRTADGDVVDVVAGHGRHRPLLTPPRHAPVDQPAVAPEAGVGPDAQSLGHAGPEALDQPVGLLDEPEHELDGVGVLEIDADRGTGPVQQVPVRPRPRGRDLLPALDRARRRPLEPQDLRPGVGQHHAGVGRRPDSRQLNDLDPAQRSTAVGHRRMRDPFRPRRSSPPRPAPSWGHACRPRPWTSDHHRRPHRLQRRALAPHGHRPGHRGRLHAQSRQLPLRDRLGPVPRDSPSRSCWATPPRCAPRPPWRPGSCGPRPCRRAGWPGSPAPCRSAPACPRVPPSPWRCCSPWATTPIP